MPLGAGSRRFYGGMRASSSCGRLGRWSLLRGQAPLELRIDRVSNAILKLDPEGHASVDDRKEEHP